MGECLSRIYKDLIQSLGVGKHTLSKTATTSNCLYWEAQTDVDARAHSKVRGQLVRIDSLLATCGFQDLVASVFILHARSLIPQSHTFSIENIMLSWVVVMDTFNPSIPEVDAVDL